MFWRGLQKVTKNCWRNFSSTCHRCFLCTRFSWVFFMPTRESLTTGEEGKVSHKNNLRLSGLTLIIRGSLRHPKQRICFWVCCTRGLCDISSVCGFRCIVRRGRCGNKRTTGIYRRVENKESWNFNFKVTVLGAVIVLSISERFPNLKRFQSKRWTKKQWRSCRWKIVSVTSCHFRHVAPWRFLRCKQARSCFIGPIDGSDLPLHISSLVVN